MSRSPSGPTSRTDGLDGWKHWRTQMLVTGGHRLSPKLRDFITRVIVTISLRTHDRYFVRILEAARHAHHICSPYLSDLHIARRHARILSSKSFRQRSIGHALRIDASGSEFFHAVKHAPFSFDKPSDMRLRSVKREPDASRLRSLKSSFFVTLVPFFVSIMYVLREQGGGPAWKKEAMRRRAGMHGRV